MAYTESSITITTQDFTQRSTQVSTDISVVSVIDVPTGNYEETLISSVSEFVDEYLLGSAVLESNSETAKNVAKLLQTMPVRCIRASNTKLRAGINNKGEVIYTNSDFIPFQFSQTFTINSNPAAGNYGYLTINSGYNDGSGVEDVTIKLDDDTSYSSDDSDTFASTTVNISDVVSDIGSNTPGIDPIIGNMGANSIYNKLNNVGVSETDTTWLVYTYGDASISSNGYPDWISEVNVSNLSSSSKEVTFNESGSLISGNYINFNGYSFYLQKTGELFNTIIPGTTVEVSIPTDAEVTPSVFSLFVNDLVQKGNYSKPLLAHFDVSVAPGGLDTIKVAGTADFVNAVVVNGQSIEAYADGTRIINSGSRLIVSDVDYVADTKTYTLEFNSNESVSTTDYIDYYQGVNLVVVDNKNNTYRFPITTNGDRYITVGENQIKINVTDYNKFTVDGIANYKTIYTFKVEYKKFLASATSDTYLVFYAGANYPIANGGEQIATYSISDGSVTAPLAVYQMGRVISNATDTDNSAVTTIGATKMILSNSAFRTVETNVAGITINTTVTGLKRYSFSKDSINFQNIKNDYAIKIDDNVFYCGSYNKLDNNEVLIRLDVNQLSYGDFMYNFFQTLPQYYDCLGDNNTSFTLFNNSGDTFNVYFIINDSSTIVDGATYNYATELDSRFAVIANYTSSSSIFGITLTKDDDTNWYTLSLRKKDNTVAYEASFVRDTINGYGVNIYFDAINAKQTFCTLIDLNEGAAVLEIPTELEFGDEISLPSPGLTSYQSALNKLLLETGQHYDFIFTAGYDVAQYINHAATIGTQKYCQVMAAIPQGVTDYATAIEYRDATGVDNYQVSLYTPYYHDSTVGQFDTMISPACAVLERYYSNSNGLKSFAPLFWKSNGQLNISTARTSSSGIEVLYDDLDERNELLSNQINSIKIDLARNICYINDQLTLQRQDSDLSEFNNVRMVNFCAHLCEQYLDDFIAQFNDQATRLTLVTGLTNLINEEMFAAEQYKPYSIEVICDETNNTQSVIDNRELVVDVYITFNAIIKRIKVFQKVIPLQV